MNDDFFVNKKHASDRCEGIASVNGPDAKRIKRTSCRWEAKADDRVEKCASGTESVGLLITNGRTVLLSKIEIQIRSGSRNARIFDKYSRVARKIGIL